MTKINSSTAFIYQKSLVFITLLLIFIASASAYVAYQDPIIQNLFLQPTAITTSVTTPVQEKNIIPVVPTPLLLDTNTQSTEEDLTIATFNFAGLEHKIKLTPYQDITDIKTYKYSFNYDNIKGFAGIAKNNTGVDNILLGVTINTPSYELLTTTAFSKNTILDLASTQKELQFLLTMDLVKTNKVLVSKQLVATYNKDNNKININFSPNK